MRNRPILKRAAWAIVAGLSLAGAGCAASSPTLKLVSIANHKTYRQDFTHAYARRDSTGNLDVVLLDPAAHETLGGGRSSSPVRQIIHLRVLWTPAREMKAVASNAAIKWYVISDAHPQDVLEYSGTGFVSCTFENDLSTLNIQNAVLKPADSRGSLRDPVGVSKLEGTVVATRNPDQVRRVLSDLHHTVAAAQNASQTAANVPYGK